MPAENLLLVLLMSPWLPLGSSPRGSQISISTTFLCLLWKAQPSRPNSLFLGSASGQIRPAPALSVRSGGGKKGKKNFCKEQKEELFPGIETVAKEEEELQGLVQT